MASLGMKFSAFVPGMRDEAVSSSAKVGKIYDNCAVRAVTVGVLGTGLQPAMDLLQ